MKEISIVATNRNALISAIISKLDNKLLSSLSNPKDNFTFLRIVRNDCGCVFTYKKSKDIPQESVKCPHGNQIILYTTKTNKNITKTTNL